MKVFVTGGTGFVGQEIIRQLQQADHQIRILIHKEGDSANPAELETVVGDITQPETLQTALQGCDAVIHLVGIIREFPGKRITFERLHTEATRNILKATAEQGVGRYLHMSANGAREDAVTDYHKTKWAAEQLVRATNLDWTIFRPSLIFGPNDMFINMLADLIRKVPVVPVMGDGNYRLQPVSVTDVAEGYVKSLAAPQTIGKTFHCGGPDSYSYDQVLDLVGRALGKKSVRKLHQPLPLMKPIVNLLQHIPQFPMTSDQLQMLLEENICDPTEWRQTLQLELQDLPAGIARYVN